MRPKTIPSESMWSYGARPQALVERSVNTAELKAFRPSGQVLGLAEPAEAA